MDTSDENPATDEKSCQEDENAVSSPDGDSAVPSPDFNDNPPDSTENPLSPLDNEESASTPDTREVEEVEEPRSNSPEDATDSSAAAAAKESAASSAVNTDEPDTENAADKRPAEVLSEVTKGEVSDGFMYDEEKGNTRLHMATVRMDKEAVKTILKQFKCVDRVNFKNRTAFHEMTLNYLQQDMIFQSEKGNDFRAILRSLINHGLDVNARDFSGKTPLHYVAPYPEHEDLVRLFLNKEVAMNAGIVDSLKQTPLHLAVATSTFDTVMLLVEANNTVNVHNISGQTPLHIAAKGKGKAGIISYLVRQGALPNRRDDGGRTPLHVAAKAGRVENVEILLEEGARIYELDYAGQSPVHYAAAKDITGRCLACLLPVAGPEILNIPDAISQETALHKAVALQMLDNIRVLSRFRPNPNLQDVFGETALHKAVACREITVWRTLLRLRADFRIQNHAMLTPYQMVAKAKNHPAKDVLAQVIDQETM